jgi:hypothetical protein
MESVKGMISNLIKRFYRFLALFILITLCSSTGDLTKAEAVTARVDTPAESKFSCAIAKSAYGSPGLGVPVNRLRAFRDHFLEASAAGRWVARAYYRMSGSLAPLMNQDGLSEKTLKWTIRAFLYLVKYLEALGLGTGGVLIALVLGRKIRTIKPSPLPARGS